MLQPPAARSTRRTSGQTHLLRSPRVCARCAEQALSGYPFFSARPTRPGFHRRKANDSPACRVNKHAIGTLRRCGTVRILRIGSKLFRDLCPVCCRAMPARAAGARGHYSGMVLRLFGRVAEWQTRWLQVPVSFGTWGFKSPFAHHCDDARHRGQISRHSEHLQLLAGGVFCFWGW